jgi:hypothetical protein
MLGSLRSALAGSRRLSRLTPVRHHSPPRAI